MRPEERTSRPLSDRLRIYGCPDLIRLDESLTHPSQIEYLDLLSAHRQSPPIVNAVIENQGSALLYILDAGGEESTLVEPAPITRRLANRSDPAWLGVVRPGSLELYPIGFHHDTTSKPVVTIQEDSSTAPMFFQRLVHGELAEGSLLNSSDYVFKKIFGLLTQTLDAFVVERKGRQKRPIVQPLDILSMAGRALFLRFLIDRSIVRDKELPDICPYADRLKDCFVNAENAARTSAWLDETFNGDFLRLVDESIPETNREARYRSYSRYYYEIEKRAGQSFFNHLHAIINGWRSVQGGFQTELDWGDLDFAHIPVGVLSQVYESFSHRVDHRAARETSTHYTPRNVARIMVDQVFAAVEQPASAKVLDPACGAGIFLVLSFRRLVRERLQKDGKRPDTRTIQSILYNQIRGFDTSESALRLAALALYITAIEVNGTQRPPKALRFPRNLRETVLFHFGEKPEDGESPSFNLGSLGPCVPAEFDRSFDIVIGNPPWTRLREDEPQRTDEKLAAKKSARIKSDEMNREFTAIGRRVLRSRGLIDLAKTYENPDKNPDLPFVWRAAEWAKPGTGLIAFALPARVFGRTSGKGHNAWCAILRCFTITGLINGADLRKTAVWESVDMPFCLFFARNALAPYEHRFYYATPRYEPAQNRHARFRIDYEATQPVSVERVINQPWVLKALSLGTWRDVAVMEKILDAFPRSLASVWQKWDPEGNKTGQGYNRSPGLRQKPADFLGALLDFEIPKGTFSIQYSTLESYLARYGKKDSSGNLITSAYRPKTEEQFQPPLVIIPQSPGEDPEKPRAFISDRPLAFSQSYYGYSCAGHTEAETLAALLYLLVHSNIFRYFFLMRSIRAGLDRQTFNKNDLDEIAFPDVCKLPDSTKTALNRMARQLEQGTQKPWGEIDSLLFDIYGLDDDDAQVVSDTLFSAAAYRRHGRAALERTFRRHRNPFRSALYGVLQPYFDVCGSEVLVAEPQNQPDAWEQPWFFLAISRADASPHVDTDLLRRAMDEANRLSASRVIVRVPDQRGLLLGLLNQRRWWTVTRARLCGQHILRHHLEAFGLT